MNMRIFNLNDSIGFLVNIAATKYKNVLERAFISNGFDVTAEQWAVLMCLWNRDAQTQNEIADELVKDKTNLSRILDLMQKNGYILRQQHENDRRSYRIVLTEFAKESIPGLISIANQVNNMSTIGLSGRQVEEVSGLLRMILKNLQE